MNWSLFSLPNTNRKPKGYSLTELSVVLGLVANAASWAAPQLSHWLWRWRVETVVQAWSGDLRAAQLQALRRGQSLQLQRLKGCQTAPLADGDWRCGWQLLKAQGNNPTVLVNTQLAGDVLVNISPAQNNLDINALGEPVAGGLRVVVQAKRSPNASSVRAICINTAGRMRVIKGSTCT
jgi:Tfp pilus assembly protein FimT